MTSEQNANEPNRPEIMIEEGVECSEVLGMINDGVVAYGDQFFPTFTYADLLERIPERITDFLARTANGMIAAKKEEFVASVPSEDATETRDQFRFCLDYYLQAMLTALNAGSTSVDLWEKTWDILDADHHRASDTYGLFLRDTYVYAFGLAQHLPETLVDKVLSAYLRKARCAEDQVHELDADKNMNRHLAAKIRQARLARSEERFQVLGLSSVAMSKMGCTDERIVLASLPVQEAYHQNVSHIPREIFRELEGSRNSVCLQIWQTMSGLRVVMAYIQDLENACGCGHCSYDGAEVVVLGGRRYGVHHEHVWVVDAAPDIFLGQTKLSELVDRARAKAAVTAKLLALLP